MQLRTDKGGISLPANFKFDITTNHPFFSDEGSASAPATLPSTPQNKEIFDFPENPNRRQRFIRTFPGALSHGTFFRPCRIIVSSASKTNGISASIALRESEMYAEIQDLRLKDLFSQFNLGRSGVTPWYFYANSVETMEAGYFTFFPVATDLREENGNQTVNIMNRPTAGKEFIWSARTINHGGENIPVPAGYGLAPYFYLKFVIQFAFQYCGFEVEQNVFSTDSILSKIVLLHRYADLLIPSSGSFNTTGWNIFAPAMVPDITMGELITFLHDKFGAFVTVRGRKVSIRLFRDIVSADYDVDLTGSVAGDISISYPEPSGLTMESGDGIESGNPAAESMESLMAEYKSLANAATFEDIQGSGLFYVESLGKYYHKKQGADAMMVGSANVRFSRTVDGVTNETDIRTDDVFVPMVRSSSLYMPYVGDASHHTIEIEEKGDPSDPIMLCFAKYYEDGESVRCQGQTTPFNYKLMDTSDTGLVHLTPEGIVPTFFSEWWRLLANGAPDLSCRLHLTLEQLETMDLFSVKLLNGCRVLFKSVRYSISSLGLTDCEAVFLLLPDYADALDIPAVSFGSKILWKRISTRRIFPYGDKQNGIEILETDGLSDYTEADAPDYMPNRVGTKAKTRKRWLRYREYITKRWPNWFTPSDHSEYTSTETYDEYFISFMEE